MRTHSILLAGLVALACARATTLQQLSLDDMIQQSTGIVRAKVTGSRADCAARTFTPSITFRFWRQPKRLEIRSRGSSTWPCRAGQ